MQRIELNPGQVVELELAKSKNDVIQFRTLVEENEGDTEFVLLAPMYKGTPYPFRDQEKIDVIYTIHDDENKPHAYVFRSKISERYRRGNLTYIRITRDSGVTKLQRRGFYRLNYVADMKYECLTEEGSNTTSGLLPVITRDISAGGFRGIVTQQIPLGSRILFHLDLGAAPLLLFGRVISSERLEDSIIRYEIRVGFSSMSAKETGNLIQAINQMQSEYIRRMSASTLEDRLAMYGNDELLYSERRRGKDWVLRWLDWSVVLTWFLSFVIMVNFLLAMPERANSIDMYYGFPVRTEWDMTMIQRNIYFLLALFVITSFSVIMNSTRRKREGDHFRYPVLIMGVISLILIFVYILLF